MQVVEALKELISLCLRLCHKVKPRSDRDMQYVEVFKEAV